MKFENSENKTEVILRALYYATKWEESLIDAHEHCISESDIQFKELCNANIRDFEKVRLSIMKR